MIARPSPCGSNQRVSALGGVPRQRATVRVVGAIALVGALLAVGAVGCQRHALQIAVVDFDAQPVAGARVSGWYLTDGDVDASKPDLGEDVPEAQRRPIDGQTDDGGVVAVPADGLVRIVWLQVWLPRRAWPGFRLDQPLRLDRRDSPDVLGYDLFAQTKTHTVIQLTINVDPTARAVDADPSANAPRNWPPIVDPD